MQNDDIFIEKLWSFRKNLVSQIDQLDRVDAEADTLYRFIKNHFKDYQLLNQFDLLINSLISDESLKQKLFINRIFKKFINLYFAEISTDFYISWGILFYKILQAKTGLAYPAVYSAIFRIYYDRLDSDYSDEELAFPLAEEIDLHSLITAWQPILLELITVSDSYHPVFQKEICHLQVKHLYSVYKKTGKLRIWFPCAGIGIEPLLLTYMLHLEHELTNPGSRMKNLKVICSDPDYYLLEQGLRINPLNYIFTEIKANFAKENRINEKNLITSVSAVKKCLICERIDFFSTGRIYENEIDLVIINSLKYADIHFYQKKLIKRFNKLGEGYKELEIILEVKTESAVESGELTLGPYKAADSVGTVQLIFDLYDYHLSYPVYKINAKRINEADDIPLTLNGISAIYSQYDKKELKKQVIKIDPKSINTEEDYLVYADLLAEAGLFQRAYDVLKKYYPANYNTAYQILKKIIKSAKNEKLIKKIKNFLLENQIKEKGFSADLLDALIDGIEEFELENKSNRWL